MILVADVDILLSNSILLVVSVEGPELCEVHIHTQPDQHRLIIERRLEALGLAVRVPGPRSYLLIKPPELTQVQRIE